MERKATAGRSGHRRAPLRPSIRARGLPKSAVTGRGIARTMIDATAGKARLARVQLCSDASGAGERNSHLCKEASTPRGSGWRSSSEHHPP